MIELTLLRYPGNKLKYKNYVEHIVQNIQPSVMIEPYAGSGILSLSFLIEHKVDYIVLNDLDPAIYAFWHTCLYQSEWLINQLNTTKITIKEWEKQHEIIMNPKEYSTKELGFAALFLNRCNVSGIIKGKPIGGMSQDKNIRLSDRFEKTKIAKTIRLLQGYKDQIELYQEDALYFLKEIAPIYQNSFLIIDPPQITYGSQIYQLSYKKKGYSQHQTILNFLYDYQHPYLLFYDHCDYIHNIAMQWKTKKEKGIEIHEEYDDMIFEKKIIHHT